MDVNDLSIAAVADLVEVDVLEAKEVWSEYRLADGTILRIKPIMIAVTRVTEADAENGEPVYNMRSTLVTDVRGTKPSPNLG